MNKFRHCVYLFVPFTILLRNFLTEVLENFSGRGKIRLSGRGIRNPLEVWTVLIMITEEALRHYTLVYYTLV
jgi:hypothetical protein